MNRQTLKYFLIVTTIVFAGCTRTIPAPTAVVNQTFPSVIGKTLNGEKTDLPDSLKGECSVLLIGYKQNAQFDIDRWILGLMQAEVKTKIVEVPTISGMIPGLIQNTIDNGMRSGIPSEDWGSVVTVYDDAEKIIKVLGNERPQSAYVVLLDRAGQIIWTTNRGYSAGQVLQLKGAVEMNCLQQSIGNTVLF